MRPAPPRRRLTSGATDFEMPLGQGTGLGAEIEQADEALIAIGPAEHEPRFAGLDQLRFAPAQRGMRLAEGKQAGGSG